MSGPAVGAATLARLSPEEVAALAALRWVIESVAGVRTGSDEGPGQGTATGSPTRTGPACSTTP